MLLVVNGVDLTCFVAENGFKWQRNDIDGENAGRIFMDPTMNRDRVAVKPRLDITCIPLSQEEAETVLQAIYPEYVTVKYQSPMSGIIEVEMYSNNVPATYMNTKTGKWDGIVFPLITV